MPGNVGVKTIGSDDNMDIRAGDTIRTCHVYCHGVKIRINMFRQNGRDTAVAAAAQSTIQVRYVCIVLAVIPILIACPFVQKYLVKGTMLGAVKG